MGKKIDIPRGNEYRSLHEDSKLNFYEAVNELIDNSRDNHATIVETYKNGESYTIIDNGDGLKDTEEEIRKILRSGSDLNRDDPSKEGQYGVGLNQATQKIGKGIHVWTKSKNCKPIEFDVAWKKLNYEEGIEWDYAEERGIEHGTIIEIFFDEEDDYPFKNPGRTSFQYYDRVIKQGNLTIIDNGEIYKPIGDPLFNPDFKPEILENIIYDGRKFDLKIGILHKDYLSNTGFYVYSKETLRYYLFKDTFLDDTISARDGLYVEIGLHKAKLDWRIDKNKRGVGGIKTVAKYLKDYGKLDNWRAKLYNGKRDETCKKAQKILNEIFGYKSVNEGEETRVKTGNHGGTNIPKNTGRKREEADKIREHPFKNVKLRNVQGDGEIDLIPEHLTDKRVYLRVNRNGDSKSFVVNKNNEFINKKLMGDDVETIVHLCCIAYMADKINIKDDELPYGIVDPIFYQHEYFNNKK